MAKRRRLRFELNARTFWVWFGGIWLAIGVMFLLVGGYAGYGAIRDMARLDSDGQRVRGVVLEKSVKLTSSRTSASPNREYWLTYRFTTSNGDIIEDSARIDEKPWTGLEERGAVEVVYLPDQPRLHRVEGQGHGLTLVLVLTILGTVLTLLGGAALISGLRLLRRHANVGSTRSRAGGTA